MTSPSRCLFSPSRGRRLPLRISTPPLVGEPVLTLVRTQVLRSLQRLFAPEPLALVAGDTGLFGPDSLAWRVQGDVSVFLGAIRALVVQGMHPEVVAGTMEHSTFRDDPIRRLQTTSAWVTRVVYASSEDARTAAASLAAVHHHVVGVSHRGRSYRASDPALLSWVHNALVESFLAAYQRFGPGLSDAEADGYVAEMTRIGELLGCDALPDTAALLTTWLCEHPDLGDSPGLRESLGFLSNPPLGYFYKVPYWALFHGALASLPEPLAALAPRTLPGAGIGAETVLLGLRSILGKSRVQEPVAQLH